MKYLEKLFNVKGKVVVITGARGLLGQALIEAFCESGAMVIGVDLFDRPRDIPHTITGVQYYKMDITCKKEIDRVFRRIKRNYGFIDILINNAGVSTSEPPEIRSEEKIDWMMDVNLKGTFFCIQNYIDLFDQHKLKQGNIINIASIYGLISPDFRIYEKGGNVNSEIYGATKAGIIQMTKYFAVYLADRNIRVNTISPGGIFNNQDKSFVEKYSARVPIKRMANVDEITGAAIYLASEASSYVTGTNLVIDGGMSSW